MESLPQSAALTAPSSEGALGFPTPTWNMKNPTYDRRHRSDSVFCEALPERTGLSVFIYAQ